MTNTNEITTGMGNVALDVVGNEPLAAKNKKKTPGRDPPPRPVTITKNTPMYKYDVKVMFVYSKADGKELVKERSKSIFKGPEHERDKGLCSLAYKKAVRQCPELQTGGPFYYDRQASLYSLSLLKKDPLTLNLTGTDLSQKSNFLRVEFTVTKVADSFQSTSNAIKQSVNIRPNLADKTILEALNLMVSGKALEDPNVLTMGNCVHYLYNDDHIKMDRVRVIDGEKTTAVGTVVLPKISGGWLYVIFLLGLLIHQTSASPQTATCEDGHVPFNGSCYHFEEEFLNYAGAREKCASKNGTLFVLSTDEEWKVLRKYISEQPMFIGMKNEWTLGAVEVEPGWESSEGLSARELPWKSKTTISLLNGWSLFNSCGVAVKPCLVSEPHLEYQDCSNKMRSICEYPGESFEATTEQLGVSDKKLFATRFNA